MVEKYIQNGKVAVMFSPGFGAGWSTWSPEYRDTLLFDREIAEAIINGDASLAKDIARKKCPDAYISGQALEIIFVEQGSMFFISEYDGSESFHLVGGSEYVVA